MVLTGDITTTGRRYLIENQVASLTTGSIERGIFLEWDVERETVLLNPHVSAGFALPRPQKVAKKAKYSIVCELYGNNSTINQKEAS